MAEAESLDELIDFSLKLGGRLYVGGNRTDRAMAIGTAMVVPIWALDDAFR